MDFQMTSSLIILLFVLAGAGFYIIGVAALVKANLFFERRNLDRHGVFSILLAMCFGFSFCAAVIWGLA